MNEAMTAAAKSPAEHTTVPWKIIGKPDDMIVCDAEGGSIADCAPPGPWMRHKVAAANAAFIVKAVNSHDVLVKALEGSQAMLQLLWTFTDASGARACIDEQLKINVAALTPSRATPARTATERMG